MDKLKEENKKGVLKDKIKEVYQEASGYVKDKIKDIGLKEKGEKVAEKAE